MKKIACQQLRGDKDRKHDDQSDGTGFAAGAAGCHRACRIVRADRRDQGRCAGDGADGGGDCRFWQS
ncbi:conserved hypothetical protein [Ricinus communis]|uniref:Uncharacterized protein n=1 Tax=Ricinus communis TaxID=3988 RepID=B9TQ21_RICCO|nr:conserved hypothetical protein [Ricinus communis]